MTATELTKLEAKKRDETGKEAAKRYRNADMTPCIIYGLGADAISITIPTMELAKTLQQAEGELLEISVDGAIIETVQVLEIQRETITDHLMHVDFKRLDLTAASEFTVRLEFSGDSVGVRGGGIRNVIEDTIDIECLPTDLPSHLDVNISLLDIGDALYARDIKLPEGVSLVSEPEIMIVNITTAAAEEVEKVAEPVEGEEAEEAAEGEKEEERPGHKGAGDK